MGKNILTEDTVIVISQSITLGEYRKYFEKTVGEDLSSSSDFFQWLDEQTGKTLKEAVETYYMAPERKNMEDLLSEERFNVISEPDKAFIVAFDEKIRKLGYDSGGSICSGKCWGKYMIIYKKSGVKSKTVIARIYVRDDGIVLRLFFNNVDKHSAYIENAPGHIKDVFTGEHGNCNHCAHGHRKDGFCKFRKTYTIDGKLIEKCNGVVFEFWQPTVEKLPDYINLLTAFYPVNKSKLA